MFIMKRYINRYLVTLFSLLLVCLLSTSVSRIANADIVIVSVQCCLYRAAVMQDDSTAGWRIACDRGNNRELKSRGELHAPAYYKNIGLPMRGLSTYSYLIQCFPGLYSMFYHSHFLMFTHPVGTSGRFEAA